MTPRAALAMLLLIPAAAAACKRRASGGSAGAGSGPAGPASDRGVAVDGAGGELPEEAAVRAGKRTGLGAADERPEVATEPLARGLFTGQVAWARLIDPASGVVVLRSLPPTEDGAPAQEELVRRCGAELDRALAEVAAAATAALADPGLVYDVLCDNVGLAVTVAGVASHAVCSVASPAEDGLEVDLVLVPDPDRGLRLIGASVTHAVTTPDAVRDRFDEELGRYGARCP